MGLSGSLQRNMAKFVCLFALVGVAAGAPSPAAVRVVNANNQRDVVNTIMTTLEPSIDAAIAKALREYSFSLISSPVQFAGAASQGSFGAAGQSSQSSFSSSSSSSGSSASQQAVSQGAAHQKGVHFQTAGAGGVVYHDGSSQQLSGSSGSQQQSTSTIVQNNAKLTSVSASQQQQVVEKVMNALAPSIEAAVQAALLNLHLFPSRTLLPTSSPPLDPAASHPPPSVLRLTRPPPPRSTPAGWWHRSSLPSDPLLPCLLRKLWSLTECPSSRPSTPRTARDSTPSLPILDPALHSMLKLLEHFPTFLELAEFTMLKLKLPSTQLSTTTKLRG